MYIRQYKLICEGPENMERFRIIGTQNHFEESLKNPIKKWFWSRFEFEAFKHDIKLLVIDGDTGEVTEPLSVD